MAGVDENLIKQASQKVQEVNWDYLFSPNDWYITPAVIQENLPAFGASLAGVFVAFLVFYIIRAKGMSSEWYANLKQASRLRLSDDQVFKIWSLMYIPLFLSSFLVWVYGGQVWTRALTVYSLHMIVNVLFAVSMFWVKDLSLALLNLFTLIGVAMFTTSQFASVLYFASYILTPYLLFLLAYTLQFCYFWYLNEGKELMDLTKQLKGGKGAASASGEKKKKSSGIPEDEKKRLQEKTKKLREEYKKSPKTPTSDSEDNKTKQQ